MSTYLSGEARWARTQALEVEQQIESLRDPRSLEQKRATAAKTIRKLQAQHRLEMANATYELEVLADEEQLAERIKRLERDRTYWQQLAEGHEARLAHKDDVALFDEDQPA